MAEQTIAERIEEAEAEFGAEITITGGGRGWTATAVDETGVTHTAKSDSKGMALSLIINTLTDLVGEDEEPEAEAEFEGECSDECMSSVSTVCQCKCEGANHGGGLVKGVVLLGDKRCKCGCGQTTKRSFVPGHDARYHAEQKAKALGITVEEMRKRTKKAANERATAKRREQRAAAKALEVKAAEVAKSVKPVKKGKAVSPKGDALPF